MKEYRVGIIGFGFMGKTHAYGYRTLPLYYRDLPFKIRLAGVCTRRIENAERARDSLGFDFATDNPEDILLNKNIDIVNICTPNTYHKDAAIKALENGKHVYCEKPLAVNRGEAVQIQEAAEKSGAINQIVFNYRFLTATMKAKELIEEGRLGRILSFRASYLHSGSVDPNKPAGWRFDINEGGGGVLFDLGSHILDILYYLIGDYSSIMAKTRIVYNERPDKSGKMVRIFADDAAYMLAMMKNGSIGTIEASKIATGANDELKFEINGDKGAVKFNLMEPNWLEFFDNTVPEAPLGGYRGFTRIECVQRYPEPGGGFPNSKSSIGWIRGHVHCLYSFLSAVHENKQASPSFRDGAYIQHVMEKAYESDRTGQWVKV